MAIGFARLEFVKRSSGKTACAKSAYNSRSKIKLEFPEIGESKTFDWSYKEKPLYNEILIPENADKKFKSADFLWNAVEKFETRKNSQVAMELVLALPDDKTISNEDRIELAKSFVVEQFILNGFAAQIDIHIPEKTEGTEREEHNWHAHVLVSPRRFTQDGQTFEKHKPRDLMPVVRGGNVIAGPDWGKLWTSHQNQYFESKGLSLRVDPNGIISQLHLGPVRMRGRAISLLEEHSIKVNLNAIDVYDPKKILENVTKNQNIFSDTDIDRFFQKHVAPDKIAPLREEFWKQDGIVQLLDKKTGQTQNRFTTTQIVDEENKIMRIGERLVVKNGFRIKDQTSIHAASSKLTIEQSVAFENIINGKRLSCIEGLAGTGKSHLLAALKNVYQEQGYIVRGIGPDNATADVLKKIGFANSENVYRFLHLSHFGKKEFQHGREVWFLDEAGKLGSQPFLEFLKAAENNGVQVICSGDTCQIPSVERGRMFMTFCEKFGCEFLQDIQRQKAENQRNIAKKLATGKIAQAFDQITSTGGFRWSETKQESIENLIMQWAKDKEFFPNSSTLILAHSNAEVSTLNEYIRVYRKERGELGDKEFLCETSYGKIYVSDGDPIEFRKNDRELGVTNGMVGTVLSTSSNQFVVKIHGENKKKEVIFDPRAYSHFQLGYATTYYRSQGRTIDRAYILHSPMMNRETFYVGLTRHVRNAFCFVARSETSCLADLKRQAMRRSQSLSTTDFYTYQQWERQKYLAARKEQLDNFTLSDSLLTRLKGKTLHAIDNLQEKTSAIIERLNDRIPDRTFYKQTHDEKSYKESLVIAVPEDNGIEPKRTLQEFVKPAISIQEEAIPNKSQPLQKSSIKKQAWANLTENGKKVLKDYYSLSDDATYLHDLVKSEAESLGRNEKGAPHFSDWMQACAKRNQTAHVLLTTLSQVELQSILGKKSLEIVKYRASRHELVNQPRNSSVNKLENSLKENIDGLLVHLFPEGPTRRESRGLRFGTKGSLSVSLQGSNAGSFYNFEKGEGGGLLKLIEERYTLNRVEAIEWAKNFLGQPQSITNHSRYAANTLESKNQDTWVSIRPPTDMPAPVLSAISIKLNEQYREAARHVYKDSSGNVLFYILRLVDKTDPSKKMIRPLSFGFYKGGEEHPRWSLRGYQSENKPLYNLDLLHKYPDATVLIVEGEKTADAANKLFQNENIIAVTWSGGASASSKTDFSLLFMREIIIWPDNDTPGFEACNKLCSDLRRIGVNSLRVISMPHLRKEFPEKWDLADPLPSGKTHKDIQDMIANADEKVVGMIQILSALPKGDKNPAIAVLEAKEIFWRVEERLRPQLEDEYKGKSWEIRNQIIVESSKILRSKESTITNIQIEFGLDKTNSERLAFASMTFQASKGAEPTLAQLDNLRQILPQLEKVQSAHTGIASGLEAREFVLGKYLATRLEAGTPSPISEKNLHSLRNEIQVVSEQSLKIGNIKVHAHAFEKDRQLDHSI